MQTVREPTIWTKKTFQRLENEYEGTFLEAERKKTVEANRSQNER